jgi:hypothetical protein
MTTELLDFHPSWGVTLILLGSVTGNARRALSRVGATFRTFQGDDDPCAWLCHNLKRPYSFLTQLFIVPQSNPQHKYVAWITFTRKTIFEEASR